MSMATMVRAASQVFGRLCPDATAKFAEDMVTRPRRRQVAVAQSATGLHPGEWITLGGHIHALRWGQDGPAVVALHGWEGHPGQFTPLANRLAAAGYQVFSLNAPAHGKDANRRTHVGAFADYLGEASREIGTPAGIIGHSMGAGATLIAMAAGLAADKAVLIAGPADFRGILRRASLELGLPASVHRRFLQRMQRRVGLKYSDLRAETLLTRINSPLLVVHDHGDRQIPFRDAERLVHGANQAELLATTGLGHGRILASDAVAERITGFLQAAQV
ncbi:alpha-beta hydrolase superfamily lysophospholipase [Natronocella acetinitrilica]|uniref:Alpha-beta hydrolase superfamily lysophospholipase n=1 Tax=Natronocella acetinitrilica TaxID=414046 RepID=A0AAE3KE61_9GAMM|nr:alpha/beta fold hydrolase [Natronocella acetinitrilica]MCP1677103.1 alpha-beta hydrolase superfamily lysophospholipase [Natronocella acetinitrilica]